MAILAALNIYPIKGCRGHASLSAFVERRGLRNDRRMMLVDADGDFITQREYPRLALVAAELTDTGLNLAAPHMPGVTLATVGVGSIRPVNVWSSQAVAAIDQGDQAAGWFSTYLQASVRLVFMPENSIRPVNPAYAVRPDDHVSFADGYPILIISQESLDDLNARLDTPLPMNRFRPNLVVQGCQPFAEDSWKHIRIGKVEIALVKPCARCLVTTTDQETAVRAKEPLKTLATFRRRDGNKLMFGMNAIPLNEGRLQVGAEVEVLD